MSDHINRQSNFDWKLLVALAALLIAIIVLFYGNGLCNQVNPPGWTIPVLSVVCPYSPATPTPSPTPTDWPLNNLVYQEDFERPLIQGWEIKAGSFQRVNHENNNFVWQTSTNSQAFMTLPISGSDYAMEARVKQVSGGQALPILDVRYTEGSPCDADYRTYFDTYSGWLTLVESGLTTSGTCDELRVGGTGLVDTQRITLSNNTWYKLRIEVKGEEIRVYLDDRLRLHGKSNTLHSNRVGIQSYSEDSQFIFDFDDIKIWELAP